MRNDQNEKTCRGSKIGIILVILLIASLGVYFLFFSGEGFIGEESKPGEESGTEGESGTGEGTGTGGESEAYIGTGTESYSGDWSGSGYSGSWQFTVDWSTGNVSGMYSTGDTTTQIDGVVSQGTIDIWGPTWSGVTGGSVEWSGSFSLDGSTVSGSWQIPENPDTPSGTWSGSMESTAPESVVSSATIPSQFWYSVGLAWRDGHLWLVDQTEKPHNNIYKFDTNGNLISSIEIDDNYIATGLTWDGSNFWQSNYENNEIKKITPDGTVLNSFSIYYFNCGYQGGLAWDGSNLWRAESIEEKVYRHDTDGTELVSFGVPTDYCQGLTWDGENLWLADSGGVLPGGGAGSIYKLAPDGTVLAHYEQPVGDDIMGLAWDGEYLWYVDASLLNFYQIDTSKLTPVS